MRPLVETTLATKPPASYQCASPADLGFLRLEASYRLLGEEQHTGVRAYKVEEAIPQDRAYYSRIITWVAADTMHALELGGELYSSPSKA